MGFESYAILGYRNGKSFTACQLANLITALENTYCYTSCWQQWYGERVKAFDRLLLESSHLVEFFLILIGEEGNKLEVVNYRKGKMTKTEYSMLSLEIFSGYTMKELNKLPECEAWTKAYDDYREHIQSTTAESLRLSLINLPAPDENDISDTSSSEEEEDDD